MDCRIGCRPRCCQQCVCASNEVSWILGIDDRNVHVNIHKDAGVGIAGLYGAVPDVVKWGCEVVK